MDEIMERATLEGEILGWFDWLKPKRKSISTQYGDLRREINALIAKVNQKRARLQQLQGQMRTTAPWASKVSTAAKQAAARKRLLASVAARVAAQKRKVSVARKKRLLKPQRSKQALTQVEVKELRRRMRWGWAQRPGAPDMPGEGAAKRRSYAQYQRNLEAKIRARLISERRMGWARRPGAPDMPGEAAAKMRRAGVLGDNTLEVIDDELLL